MNNFIFFYGLPSSGKTLHTCIYSYINNNNFLDSDFLFEKIYSINIEKLLRIKYNEQRFRSLELYISYIIVLKNTYFSPGGGFLLNYFLIYLVMSKYLNITLLRRKYSTLNKKSITIVSNIHKILNERFLTISNLFNTYINND
ncbi:hypothetical protein JSR06_00785 [Candidatus Vidania fulgoroideae]|uniref:Shikimate kinase n=1 Tax=Candidatus Vidania fulgoroideorum TaxID=881286 RepID=A0A974X7G0_9PROT|nr:hypothetical protein JSR06_00785 [Candidatus Vidania fulgoroideae]